MSVKMLKDLVSALIADKHRASTRVTCAREVWKNCQEQVVYSLETACQQVKAIAKPAAENKETSKQPPVRKSRRAESKNESFDKVMSSLKVRQEESKVRHEDDEVIPTRKRDAKTADKADSANSSKKRQTMEVDPCKFEVSARNTNYFRCPGVDLELMGEIKNKVFKNMTDFNEQAIDKLNGLFGHQVLRAYHQIGKKYVIVRCLARNCIYQQWFTFQDAASEDGSEYAIANIKFFRTINHNHCVDAHEQGIIRDSAKDD